jgi:hemoglobin
MKTQQGIIYIYTMEQGTKIPSLYEWAGGMAAFEKLTEQFYKKVLCDELLEPVFKHMSPAHVQHVAHFIAEVFGGPPVYSTTDGGSHSKMVQKHFSRGLSEAQRRRWVDLLVQTADELSFPEDPEFRSAFVAYLEWGTRIAVINSHMDSAIDEHLPMPKWGWGVPGGPYQPEKEKNN